MGDKNPKKVLKKKKTSDKPATATSSVSDTGSAKKKK